jgi:hypothetical protein
MTTVLVSDLPAEQTLEMPCNNLLTTRMRTADPSTLIGNGGKIWQTLFVDAMNWSATADGSLMKPFQTLQQAINYAVAQTWTAVELLIAPATYAATVAVPADLIVVFQGWDDTQIGPGTILGGDITVVGGVGSNGYIGFSNVLITAANIWTVDPLTQDMFVAFRNCYNSADVAGFNLTLEYKQSTQGGNVSPNGSCAFRWDGPSWAYTLQVAPDLATGRATTHSYFDAGHDTWRTNVDYAGPLAVGETAFVDVAFPPNWLQLFDRVQVQFANPMTVDCLIGVHGVKAAGVVTCWLTNISRVSGIFGEECLILVHHDQIVGEPAP